jgi:hypothetical protein
VIRLNDIFSFYNGHIIRTRSFGRIRPFEYFSFAQTAYNERLSFSTTLMFHLSNHHTDFDED